MLKITMEFRKGILFVRLKGKMKNKENIKFKKIVAKTIEDVGIKNVVLNIKELKEVDVKGVFNFFYIYELVKKSKGDLYMCDYDSPVFDTLKKKRVFKYIKLIKKELDVYKLVKI